MKSRQQLRRGRGARDHYFVLLADLVASQRLEEREQGTRKIKKAIDNLNRQFREDIFAPMEITRGDEAAAVLKRADNLYEMLLGYREALSPLRCRIVVTYGRLVAGLSSRRSTEIDGPAFYAADALMQDLKKSSRTFGITTGTPLLDEAVAAVMNLLWLRWEDMTTFQRTVVRLYRQGNTQAAVGRRLRRAQQQVSLALSAVSYDTVRDAETSVKRLIGELQRRLNERSRNDGSL